MRLLRFAALSKWFQRGATHLAGFFASMGYFCLCSNCSNSRRDHPWKLPRWSVKLYAVYKASFELPLFPPPFSSVFITTSYLSLLLLFSSPMLGNFPLSPTFYPAPYASLSVQKHCKDLKLAYSPACNLVIPLLIQGLPSFKLVLSILQPSKIFLKKLFELFFVLGVRRHMNYRPLFSGPFLKTVKFKNFWRSSVLQSSFIRILLNFDNSAWSM